MSKLAELRKSSPGEVAEPIRFDTYAEGYLWTRRPGEPGALAPMSYYKEQRRLAILNKTFGHLALHEITSMQVRGWWNAHSTARSARRDTYRLLKTIMTLAVDDELITRNPCRVKNAAKDVSQKRPTFTESDVAKLYFSTDEVQTRGLLTLLSGTAMRIGEAVALDWEDISFFDATANVLRHLTPKGMRTGTKTGEEDTRHLALPTWVSKELEALYALRSEQGEVTGAVFNNQRGGRLSVDSAERIFRKLRKVAGLEEMHLHDLRHISLTTYGRQPGVTLADIMARGGHKSERIAMRYQHTDSERDRQMVSTLPNPMAAEHQK
ncbi:tyrosine-type recombinase/integrase [Microbacterium foliorum]|uniref:tyrosine-type recombinase/integrase n=1 Tax=Microbacterium foliorum TaxID=104336 RepID=UPI0013B3E05A|nr:tyrosine-type recombinase/integrase [Microbacterium foliorum]